MPSSTADEYDRECIDAAYASRLDPSALLIREYKLLGITDSSTATVYLDIRNAVLRLWRQNPAVLVTREKALATATETRHRSYAIFAHEFLTRNGYINYGPKNIVIIGAGTSGLACARHLTGLMHQFPEKWLAERREALPKVVLVEGRDRIGGRVYSHPLLSNGASALPLGLSSTAELGAQVITGFEHGNPLDAIIRGQLCLHYHLLSDDITLRDFDGSSLDDSRDQMIQKLHNGMLDAASPFAWDYNLSSTELGAWPGPERKLGRPVGSKNGTKQNGFKAKGPAEVKPLKTLGTFLYKMISRNQQSEKLSAQDMRLLNWHLADLEYAYASPLHCVSLGGWDHDNGNEFEGRHSQVVGGYSQMIRGLWKYPFSLDVRLNKQVTLFNWSTISSAEKNVPHRPGRLDFTDGTSYNADYIISTLPLGVYHHEAKKMFNPRLPDWKLDAMSRIEHGVLNKIVLVFDHIFWERDRDLFGYLNQSVPTDSLRQDDYNQDRGRCYFFWNCIKTSGVPMLIGLMAGEAALKAEKLSDEVLVQEATEKLAIIFQLSEPPKPVEAVITRWASDPFSRGTYSHPGPNARLYDYEKIAKSTGNLFFAGEATSVSYPASVHGAYLSGVRAAAEVMEAMVGPERLVNRL